MKLDKGLAKGIVQISLLVLVLAAFGFFVFNFVVPVLAEGATVWTTDADGNVKTDFDPAELVYIHGTAFLPASPIFINATRPDGANETCDATSCNKRFNGLQNSSEQGDFVYIYLLDGIEGNYTVYVTDGTNSAQTSFTDTRTTVSATLNGGSSVTVAPGASITANVTGTTNPDDWEGTGWRISTTVPESMTCADTTDYSSGTHWVTFNITAPSSTGTYNAYFRISSSDGCSSGSGSLLTMTGAVKVVECIAASDCPDRAHSSKACTSNVCGYTCSAGYGDCNSNMDDGCEINLLDADNNHCGSCTTVCTGAQTCISGACVPAAHLNPQQDTYVQVGEAGSTHDDDDVHVKWSNTNTDDQKRSYLKFDISSIPSGATITSATLRLYQFAGQNDGSVGVYNVSNNYKSTVNPWTETGLTYTNAPIDFSTGVTTVVDNSNGYKSLTVSTTDVTNALSGGILSLSVRIAPESGSYHHDFCDKEGTGGSCDSTTKPELVILYTVPPACTDTDSDGYGSPASASCTYPELDCDDTNAAIHPGATEVCTGGLDEDCDQAIDCADPDCTGNPACVVACSSYTDGTNCEIDVHCDWCTQCSSKRYSGGADRCVDAGACAYACEFTPTAFCGAICEATSDCPNKCYDPTTYMKNGYCGSNCLCDYTTFVGCNDGDICTTDSCDDQTGCVHTPIANCCYNDNNCDFLDNTCADGVCTANQCTQVFKSSATVCKAIAGVCDVAEYCTGSSAACPADVKSTALCRGSAGICDVDDYCDGATNDCPTDAFLPDTTVCRESAGQCDIEEKCTGSSATCPSDSYKLLSTPCDNQLWCDGPDHCDGYGACLNLGPAIDCDDYNPCTVDTCDEEKHCVNTFSDITGPTTSNVVPTPYYNNGNFDVTATATDACSNIQTSEYFVGHGLGSCGIPGTGTPMNPTDGNFDEQTEDIYKNNVQYFMDGLNYICIQSKDTAQNWGNCACAYFETDVIPPACPYDIYLDSTPNPREYLVCGNNAWLNASVCDSESTIQGGEYFLDITIPPIPAPWSGVWMNVLENFAGNDGEKCAVIGASVDTSNLEDGTHYINLRGKDIVENWGKMSECGQDISFIVDTTSPTTTKTVDEPKVQCGITDDGEGNAVEQCWYIQQGTGIHLSATDSNPGDGEFAGVDKIMCQFRWKLNLGDSWNAWSSPAECPNPIVFTQDSYHEIKYWAVDKCSNAETPHYEIDIVDTQAPTITKSIIGPQFYNEAEEKLYINGVTQIHVVSTDPEPHPVNQVTCDWDYTVTGGTKTGHGETGVTPPFDINFPEESTHVLTITCRDVLGNERTDVETFIVDKTAPTTTKTYGTPRYPDDIYHAKWITSSTPITLTVDDTGVHKSGIKETEYRVTLLGSNEPCENNELCQQQTGSDAWNIYSTPFTIGSESCHLIEYYSVDNVDKTEVIKKQCVYVDNTGPLATKDLSDSKHVCEGAEECDYYINQSTMISISCLDQNPHPVGEDKAYYRYNVNGGAWREWTRYSEPFHFTEDSVHQLEVKCVDKLGNVGLVTAETDAVDSQPPVTTKTFDGPHIAGEGFEWVTQDTQIVLSCTDPEPHPVDHTTIYYRYKLDDGNWTEWMQYIGQFHFNEDSVHTLQFYCVDTLGNAETVHTEIDRVDSTPPTTVKTYGLPYYTFGGKEWINSSTSITLSATDGGEICHVDDTTTYWKNTIVDNSYCENPTSCQPIHGYGADWTLYTEPFTKSEESCHMIEYWSEDALGNKEPIKAQCTYVENTPPLTTKTIGQPKYPAECTDNCYIKANETQITLSCNEQGSHPTGVTTAYYRYNVDGDAWREWTRYSEPFTFPEESNHTLQFYCIDVLGNAETVKSETDNVDNTPPVITDTHVSDCAVQSGTQVKIFAHVTDAKVGVDTVVAHIQKPDGNDVATVPLTYNSTSGYYEGTWTAATPSGEGTYFIDIVASDHLGNSATQDNGAFVNVDNTSPTIYWVFSGKNWIGTGTTFYVASKVTDNSLSFERVCEPEITCNARIVDNLEYGSALDGSLTYNKTIGKCTGFVTVNATFDESPADLYVDAWDNAGNHQNEVSTRVGIDNTPPIKVSFNTDPEEGSLIKSGQRIWYEITFEQDMSGIKGPCYISMDQTNWASSPIDGNKCSGYYSVPSGLNEGTVPFILKVEDNTDNWLNDSVNFMLDNNAPLMAIIQPVPGYYGNSLPIEVTVTDWPAGVDDSSVVFRIYHHLMFWDFVDANGTLDNSAEPTYTYNVNISGLNENTNYYLGIKASDLVGHVNETYWASIPFGVDHTAPTWTVGAALTVTYSPYDKDGNVTLNWPAATDAVSGLNHYNVYVYNATGHLLSYSPTNQTSFDIFNLQNGLYTFKVTAVDNANPVGNENSGLTGSTTVDRNCAVDRTCTPPAQVPEQGGSGPATTGGGGAGGAIGYSTTTTTLPSSGGSTGGNGGTGATTTTTVPSATTTTLPTPSPLTAFMTLIAGNLTYQLLLLLIVIAVLLTIFRYKWMPKTRGRSKGTSTFGKLLKK